MDRQADGEREGKREGKPARNPAGGRGNKFFGRWHDTWPRTWDGTWYWTTAALATLYLCALGPLGLASGEAADLAAGAFGVRRSFAEAHPLVDVLARVAALVPFGDLGTRPHAVAVIGGSGALALLAARLGMSLSAGGAVPVVAGIAAFGLCRPFLEVATVRPVPAIDLVLLFAMVLLLELIRRDLTRSRVGLGLALACGLAAGASWPIRAVAWPLACGFTLWALRRGERWPLLAPMLFVAGAGIVLGGVVAASPDPSGTIGPMLIRIVAPPAPGIPLSSVVHAALIAVFDDVGVLPLLVAAVGWWVLVLRARAETLSSLLFWSGVSVAAVIAGDILLARLVIAASAAAPVAAAVGFFAQSFGRARGAAAVVLAVVVVVPPAIIGVGNVLGAPVRLTPSAVARRLDAAVDLRTASISPKAVGGIAGREAARWRRYGRAIGLGADDGR